MKLNSIILETINDQINSIVRKYQNREGYYDLNFALNEPEELVQKLWQGDPDTIKKYIITSCKRVSRKYWKWVLNQIYKGNVVASVSRRSISWVCLETPLPAGIPLHMNTDEYAKILSQYENLQSSLNDKEKDINYFDNLSDLYLTVQQYNKLNIDRALAGLEVVASDGSYKIAKVETPSDLEKVGHGTGWCTRADAPSCRSQHYIEDFGYIYVVFKGGSPYIQFTPDLSEAQYTNRITATYELIDIILGMDIEDDELIMDLMSTELFWTFLKNSPKRADIIYKYENALAYNLAKSYDHYYLFKIQKLHKYFGLDSEADKQRFQKYKDLWMGQETDQSDDTPF